jgi:hypothetical protein
VPPIRLLLTIIPSQSFSPTNSSSAPDRDVGCHHTASAHQTWHGIGFTYPLGFTQKSDRCYDRSLGLEVSVLAPNAGNTVKAADFSSHLYR